MFPGLSLRVDIKMDTWSTYSILQADFFTHKWLRITPSICIFVFLFNSVLGDLLNCQIPNDI